MKTGAKIFGLQFHPEVVHTPRGSEIIANFVHAICGCGKSWTMRNYVEQAVEQIRAQVGSERVILGLSGGVDSSVAAALLHKAIGEQLTCIFVNNGLLRGREAAVRCGKFSAGNFKIKLQYEDAAALFLRQLKGVTDPERKRKIIGKTFIEVFQSATKRAGAAKFLAQGTLIPGCDRIGAHRRQPRGDDQEPPQRGRPAQEHEVQAGRAAEVPFQG